MALHPPEKSNKHFVLSLLPFTKYYTPFISAADLDPDPKDPYVFGPPGSGSFYLEAKIVRKP
jgi:hypothetical protein